MMTAQTIDAPQELYAVQDGRARFELHRGQTKALDNTRRFVLILAGTQSGKTSFGPLWLWQEWKARGVGDYLVVSPTFPLLSKKTLPEFLRFFRDTMNLGEYKTAEKVFKMNDGSQVFFGHASDPDSLESATAKAAWLDECGQDKFSLSSWEAIQRRLSIHQGRVLGTTTPYNLGWLKSEWYDRWTAGDEDYAVIQFKSTINPQFPLAEYERAQRTLPRWKFDMFYNGLFTRPAGMIYGSFDFDAHVIEPFDIPADWQAYGGIDFGGVNTAALKLVKHPTKDIYYITNEYHAGEKTASRHAQDLADWNVPMWYGGAKSEGQWRREFRAAGMNVQEPKVAEVEVGIDRVYGAHAESKVYVFNTCRNYIDEKGRYSRKLDASGQPTEAIKDKNTFHLMDAERYVVPSVVNQTNWYII